MIQRHSIIGAAFCIISLYTCADAQLVFPHFAQGGGYQTTFTVTNLSDTATTATIQVFLESGAPWVTLLVPLPANGTGKAELSGRVLTVGWSKITPFPSAAITGAETIQLLNGSAVVAEASVLPANPNTALRVPVIEEDGIATGIAIANPSPTAATVTLTLRDQNGTMLGTQVVPLGPFQHLARFIPEFFHGMAGFEGSLELFSAPAIAVVALRQSLSGIFSTVPTASPQAVGLDALFSPNGGISARILQAIQDSQTSIDIAIYSFTRSEIADALIAARNRGVAIRIIADSDEALSMDSKIARLEAAGFQLKRTAGRSGGIMHNKYAIFDGQELLTGSYNWTASAEDRNFENVVFIRDPGAISAYQNDFNTIWNTR